MKNLIITAFAALCCLFSASESKAMCGSCICPYGYIQGDAGSDDLNCYFPLCIMADGGPGTTPGWRTFGIVVVGGPCNAMASFPQQCDNGPAHVCCQNMLPGDDPCAVADGGSTLGICSYPLQNPPAWPNSSTNDHARTAGGEGRSVAFYNGCASGYADILQTSGGVDAGSGCCSSVTKVIIPDPINARNLRWVGEACDSNRGTGGPNGVIKDCCGGAIPLTCPAVGPKADTCCIPTGTAGPAMSTGYIDPFPGWCCSGYASHDGTNMCLASPDGGVGGCIVTGCGSGYCNSGTGNCTPLDLGEPCEFRVDGTGISTGWTRGAPGAFGGGEPTTACVGGFCAHETNALTGAWDPTARCCLDRDLQPALGTPDAGLWCHSALDCCTGVCQMNGLCGKAAARQACYDDNDCQSLGFGVCYWQNGGWCQH